MAQKLTERWDKEEPIYNIGAVVRMTGVPDATLRVWERRYGFPQPARTAGGHRLYSESQVRRLQWVKTQIDDGMQTRQAIRALHSLEREGHIPENLLIPPATRPEEKENASLKVFQERLTTALLAHDVEKADQLLSEVLVVHPLENLILDVIRPTLADIGLAWKEGRTTVATEHFTTHYLRHRLLTWMLTSPRPHAVQPIVLACAPGEWHEGSLLILGVLLRRRHWPVAYLGQSVPLYDLATFVREITSPAVVLVAMTEEPALALARWPRWLPESAQSGRPAMTYGGLIFTEQPEWREKVPGTFLGETLQQGVETMDRLMREVTLLRP